MSANPRKRRLFPTTVAPPPKTATTLQLEAILDGKLKKKKKAAAIDKPVPCAEPTTNQPSTTARWSHLSRPKQGASRTNSVLASRGGLAAAPSFREKKIIVTPKPSTQNLQSKHTHQRALDSFEKKLFCKQNLETKATPLSNAAKTAPPRGTTVATTRPQNVTPLPTKTTTAPKEPQVPAMDENRRLSKSTPAALPSQLRQPKVTPLVPATATIEKTKLITEGQDNAFEDDISANDTSKKLFQESISSELISGDAKETKTSKQAAHTCDKQAAPARLGLRLGAGSKRALDRSSSRRIAGPAILLEPTLEPPKLSVGDSDEETRPKTGTLERSVSTSCSGEAAKEVLMPEMASNTVPAVSSKPSTGGFGLAPAEYTNNLVFQTSTVTTKPAAAKKQQPVNNNNFVRLNLRNSAGACRGARNKKSKRKQWQGNYKSKYRKDTNDEEDDDGGKSAPAAVQTQSVPMSRMTGLDPLDDYLDGVFHQKQAKKTNDTGKKTEEIPKCARHQRPCKLLAVKKASTGNKGRKFYVCCMPRGEQCDHFQWADDTIEAARLALLKNSSHSGFIARQVAAHVARFRTLTVPELKEEAIRRNLDKSGKKNQLLVRLSVWVRDEIVKAAGVSEQMDADDDPLVTDVSEEQVVDDDSDDESADSSDSNSSEELEFCDDEKSDDGSHGEDNDDDEAMEEIDEDKSREASADLEADPQTSQLRSTLRTVFGHNDFREGQEWAIKRCLEQKKTLLVAPTGFGKSLCYALPATLMEGVCVVVSPLISLIQDQLRSLPPRVPAATLSGSPSASQTAAIIDDIEQGRIKILFVSPERLVSPSFRRLFHMRWIPEKKIKERRFPVISLLCIDEAHCASHWAHNFRPSFLRFKSLLNLMQPRSVLAITATAGPRVIADINNTLGIQDCSEITTSSDSATPAQKDGILVMKSDRDNIDVSTMMLANHDERLSMLAKILQPIKGQSDYDKKRKRSPYEGCLSKGSVIVYVWRQMDTEVIAESLRASGVTGGVVIYHGGMDKGARSKSQNRFMRGKARVCVATVAFGLGIDKADIVGVVHMYLSSSPEHYLQEIGRAGRDGRPARAISMPLLEEVPIRHSLVHSTSIARSQIKSLLVTLRQLIKNAVGEIEESQYPSGLVHVALSLEASVVGCDCKAETLETLLSLIEQHGGDDPLLHVEGTSYDRATIALKKRPLSKLAEKEPIAACIKKWGECVDAPVCNNENEQKVEESKQKMPGNFQKHFLAYSHGSYTFSVVQCANKLGSGAEPRHVFAALRRLQSSNELELALDTTSVGRALHLKIHPRGVAIFCKSCDDALLDELTDLLEHKFDAANASSADKVLDMNYMMDQVAIASESNSESDSKKDDVKSASLQRFQELVSSYFQGEGIAEERAAREKSLLPETFFKVPRADLITDTSTLLADLPLLGKHSTAVGTQLKIGDPEVVDYTALSIAKFLHGIDTPRAPMKAFRGHPLHGKWRGVNFQSVLAAINGLMNPGSQSKK